MKKPVRMIVSTIAAFIAINAYANTGVHTWHTVSSNNGKWDARLQMINEGGFFVTRDGSALSKFNVDPAHPMDYGFGFDPGSDFNVAYTLTLTEHKPEAGLYFSSKACVFVITAAGPANPDVRTSSFNGAKCDWVVVPGVGENYTVA